MAEKKKKTRRSTPPVGKPHELVPDRAPYDRQPWEGDAAWVGFAAYRAIPTSRRTLLAAYIAVSGNVDAKETGGTWNRWSAKHRWLERAAEWDRYVDQIAQEKLAQQQAEERAQDKTRRKRFYRASLGIGTAKLSTFVNENGTVKDDAVKELSVQEARRLGETGARGLREENDDLPTQRHEHAGAGGGPFSVLHGIDPESLGPEELARRYRQALRGPGQGEQES